MFTHLQIHTGEPNPPTNLTISFNYSGVLLSWDPTDSCTTQYIVCISGKPENVTEPTLELTSEQLINKTLYESYYFNVVSVDNIGRSGNSSENSTSFSISKIC